MGFGWSLYLCQDTTEYQSGLVELPTQVPMICDDEPAPVLSRDWCSLETVYAIRYNYVDNFGAVGLGSNLTNSITDSIAAHFASCGLPVHELEVASSSLPVLGVQVNADLSKCGPTLKRLWRVRDAARAVAGRRTVSGRALEMLLGHETFLSLAVRAGLSIFHASYKFVHHSYLVAKPLWNSVREEQIAFAGLLPLLSSCWETPWSGLVYCSDASLSGWSFASREWEPGCVGAVG